jgi:phosphatidylserine/phosphatidylglycerophosphate/cardiolipin synthase-like enzyme
VDEASILRGLDHIVNRDIQWAIHKGLKASEPSNWPEVAAALLAIEQMASNRAPAINIVWTGPASGSFAARRIDQFLYDLLATAERRVLLVTFAAHKIARLTEGLRAAHARGVQVTMLLETEDDSDGQLSFDAAKAFGALPMNEIEVLQWPRASRENNAAGRPGKLHAKCAVVDDTVLVGSANLTDDAFNRNMEMGLTTSDKGLADRVVAHFRELQALGIIVPVVS